MKKILLQSLFYFAILFGYSLTVYSQTYIWGGPGDLNSEFNGGLNDWIVNPVAPNDSALWIWEADGKADRGKWWFGRNAIESPSVNNGAAVFDSDYYATGGPNGNDGDGPAPYPQTSELISPTFSCVGYESVWIRFNQYYRTWHGESKIAVSIDNGLNWSDEIIVNDDITLNNSTSKNSIKQVDISKIAANHEEVKIKFIWEGGYYFWIIDDVYIMSNPPADPQIIGTWYPPDRFETPKEIITHDSLKFKMRVANIGGTDMQHIQSTVSVINTDNYIKYYSDTTIFDIPKNDTIDISFDSYILNSEIDTGLYVALYDLNIDSAATNDNKLYGQYFHVGENYLDDVNFYKNWEYSICDDHADYSYSYQGNNSDGPIYNVYHINYYKTGDWTENPNISFVATNADVGVWMNTDNPDDLISYPVNMYVYEVADTIKDDLSNLNPTDGIIVDGNPSDQMNYVGYSAEIIENVAKFEQIFVPLASADDEHDYITLKAAKKYFLAIFWPKGTRYYQTVDNHYSGITRFFYPEQILSFRYGDYGDGPSFYGISRDIGSWAMGFKSKFIIKTKENTLPENTVTILQNPVNNNLNVKIDFENTIKKATMVIHDINGNIIHIKNIYNMKEIEESFDVGNLPSSTYIFTIFTKDKLLSKKFIIQH